MAAADDTTRIRELAHKYGFLDATVIDLIAQTAYFVRDMIRGEVHYGRTATRRADLQYVINHSHGLLLAMRRLDIRTQLSLMGTLKGPDAVHVRYAAEDDDESSEPSKTITVGLTPLRQAKLGALIDRLGQVEENAIALHSGEKPDKRGAPPTSDFLLSRHRS
jgi:hypothetical protein